jgi:GAF domain-containing protein
MEDYPEKLTESLRAMSRFLVGDTTMGDTLHRVSELATEALEGADFAGITLKTDKGPQTSVFTDPKSPEIDQSQYDTGVGPCLDAMRHNAVYRIGDTSSDTQWEPFSRAALAHGILTTLSVPLTAGTKPVGALNLYARESGTFDDPAPEHALAFGELSGIVLTNAQAYWGAFELSEQLQEAMTSRAVIEQAKGILMGASRTTAEEAFDMLVSASQRTNVKLRDVAREIVERATQRRG